MFVYILTLFIFSIMILYIFMYTQCTDFFPVNKTFVFICLGVLVFSYYLKWMTLNCRWNKRGKVPVSSAHNFNEILNGNGQLIWQAGITVNYRKEANIVKQVLFWREHVYPSRCARIPWENIFTTLLSKFLNSKFLVIVKPSMEVMLWWLGAALEMLIDFSIFR